MFKDSVVLLTEAGETKSVPLPTLSLLQACHVAERLLSAMAGPKRAVSCYETGQPCKWIPWLMHLAVHSD